MSIRTKTLFSVSARNADLAQIKATLDEANTKHFDELITFIRKTLGKIQGFEVHPHRVVNSNYVKVNIPGEKGKLSLTFSIAGYTEWPKLEIDLARLYIYVVDSTDCFWLIRLLEHNLLGRGSAVTDSALCRAGE